MTANEFEVLSQALKTVYTNDKLLATKQAMEIWFDTLAFLDYSSAAKAVRMYIQNEHFAPTPADIIKYAKLIAPAERTELTGEAAWLLVEKATHNGIYGYKEEYEKLPKEVQDVLGSSFKIRILAKMAEDPLGYERRHFIKEFDAYQTEKALREGLFLEAQKCPTIGFCDSEA